MTREYSLNAEMLDVCEDVLTALDSRDVIDGKGFVEMFPDKGRVLELPIGAIPAELKEDWRDYPRLIQAHFREALPVLAADPDGEIPTDASNKATVRITGYEDEHLYDVGRYRPEEVVDTVIYLRGQVTSRSSRRLRDEVVAFECERCGHIERIPQSGEELHEPHECGGCGNNGPFGINEGKTKVRDYQSIELQTVAEQADGETSTITLRVFDGHVGDLSPGDRAVVSADIEGLRVSENSRVRILTGDVLSITHLDTDYSDVNTDPYRDDIRAFARGDHPGYPEYDTPHDAVVDSIAPEHTGDREIKEAIAYQIFGGVEKDLPDGTWMRGNSHVLLMGDPGVGKSKIIEYVTELVPRSEYGTGKSSSKAGLTATVQKDDFEGGEGWSLEAGLLVRANNGLAAIDELDKMRKEDRDGMMEAMSQQRITVSMVKSGEMPAKTSVLAAANPKYGSFDLMEDIGHQLDLDPVLLSRFDLSFAITDETDRDADREIASDIASSARAGERIEAGKDPEPTDWDEPPIPPEMFRAYVSMAKEVVPELTDDAFETIVSEYVEIRDENDEDGPTPTTPRTVTGLIRLAEASARIRLGELVLQADVDRAVNILRTSMESLGVDPETGDLDASRFETGVGKSRRSRRKTIKTLIREDESAGDGLADPEVVEEQALEVMEEEKFEKELKLLKKRGDVYQPGGHGTLKLS